MKSFKTLQLGTPEIANKLAYDPISSSLLVSGPSISLISEHTRKDVALAKSCPAEAQKDVIPLQPPYLRFVASNDSELSLSHSGIIESWTIDEIRIDSHLQRSYSKVQEVQT